MIVETYYQAFGVVFGSWCLIQGIIDGLRPAPTEPEQSTGFETVKYFEREVETVPLKDETLKNEFELSI